MTKVATKNIIISEEKQSDEIAKQPDDVVVSDVKVPKKRGRKKKIQCEDAEKKEKPPPKKRGRKPRGGKFITPNNTKDGGIKVIQNIILHLKCNISDVTTVENNIDPEMQAYNLNYTKTSDLVNKTLTFKNIKNKTTNYKDSATDVDNSKLSEKLLVLAKQLHTNEIIDEKSACFWCTYDFDNPPIYIPKLKLGGTYHCYGCFCSPECATAFLFKESIDSSVLFERYHLLNYLYSKIYNYNTNIKPAPSPHYMLNKFYGNLTIQEYRKLLTNERLLLVIDKPLTRILPELYDDNNLFLNSGVMSSGVYNIRRKAVVQSKKDIVNDAFSGK